MGTRIFANKVDYITYLFANPEIEKAIGKKLLLPAVAVMNFMLFKRGYCLTEESSKKNRVYRGSIDTYLEKLPTESINQTVKKLIGIGEIVRTDRGDLQLSGRVLQYFYRVTENETFKTPEINEKAKTNDTDNRWSTLTGFSLFKETGLKNLFKHEKVNANDFQNVGGQAKIMNLLVETLMDSVIKDSVENEFIQDILKLFSHFGVGTNSTRELYRNAKRDFLRKEKQGEK